MLKAYGREPADISVPSLDVPNPAAVHLQNLLNGTARRSPPCLLHMAARRPPSRIPGASARRPALQKPPQHGAARKRQRSPDCATPPKRARVHASSHPSLSTTASPPALSQNLRKSARLAAKCVPVAQSCSPNCHPVLLPRRKRPLVRHVYPPLKRLRLDAGGVMFWKFLRAWWYWAAGSPAARQGCGPISLQIQHLSDGSTRAWQAPVGTSSPRPFMLVLAMRCTWSLSVQRWQICVANFQIFFSHIRRCSNSCGSQICCRLPSS